MELLYGQAGQPGETAEIYIIVFIFLYIFAEFF